MHQLYVRGARQKKLRLKKEDAWNLYEEALIVEVDTQTGAAKQCIDIAAQTPRDGRVGGGRIYFTTVDGRLVIANVDTHQVDQVIDLRKIGGTNHLLEWCRGLLPVDERRTELPARRRSALAPPFGPGGPGLRRRRFAGFHGHLVTQFPQAAHQPAPFSMVRRTPQRHIQPICRAGTPITSANGGMFAVTTVPAPMNA